MRGCGRPRALQHLGRQQLVVRGQQRAGAVEDADAARGERAERPEPVLDAVEPVDDVEPAERNGTRLQQRCRLLGRRIRASTPRGAAAARATFVAVRRWATIASSTTSVSQRIPPAWGTGR